DFLGRDRIVTQQLERIGANVLRNRNVAIERGGQRIWVAGVDDLRSRTAHLGQALAAIPADEVKILLAHNPDFAARAARIEPGIDLMLAAHTHGGQVKLPIFGPPALPHNHKEWLAGLYRVNGMWLYINRGIGMSSIAHRLNARPEVSVLILRSGMRHEA
ncbi:MAG: metallophosphoesterase, partial [Candidatus Chloroheliales bacterium]